MHTSYIFITTSIFLILISLATQSNASTSIAHHKNAYFGTATEFLAPHNAARAALRMPPLIWDARLANYAQWYANQRRYDCELRHSNGPYGENIFWGSGDGWTPAQAVFDWITERKWYDYWSNSCYGGEECGHYTQIVWSRTRRIGCARVTCDDGRGVFMTCNYDPPGNFNGERPY
ncbi:pathogenesis-related protein PR-1-like [Mercurialis annua]|uniref:pathogenesis-related protein PR-1-like n=1 Tax=Mercurialis annua TaxID=3986 RepID=UPI00215E8D64|nr:pathogenesis-related protein PR-1-like [Mercurialis annua]